MLRELVCLSALASLLAFSAGCGGSGLPKPVPVSGQILHKGQPVDDARVTFHWQGGEGGRSASGKTDGQGNFKLTTFNTGDGAIPGEYTVTVSKVTAAAGMDTSVDPDTGEYGADYSAMMAAAASGEGLQKMQPNTLPEKYDNAATSDIQRSVVAGQENTFTIDLD